MRSTAGFLLVIPGRFELPTYRLGVSAIAEFTILCVTLRHFIQIFSENFIFYVNFFNCFLSVNSKLFVILSYSTLFYFNLFYMFNVSYMFNLKRVNIFIVQFIIISIPFSAPDFATERFLTKISVIIWISILNTLKTKFKALL